MSSALLQARLRWERPHASGMEGRQTHPCAGLKGKGLPPAFAQVCQLGELSSGNSCEPTSRVYSGLAGIQMAKGGTTVFTVASDVPKVAAVAKDVVDVKYQIRSDVLLEATDRVVEGVQTCHDELLTSAHATAWILNPCGQKTAQLFVMDSGAGYSLISEKRWLELRYIFPGVYDRLSKWEGPVLRWGDGNAIGILGALELSLIVGGKRCKHKFAVVSRAAVPLLLGNDFNADHEVEIRWGHRIDGMGKTSCVAFYQLRRGGKEARWHPLSLTTDTWKKASGATGVLVANDDVVLAPAAVNSVKVRAVGTPDGRYYAIGDTRPSSPLVRVARGA